MKTIAGMLMVVLTVCTLGIGCGKKSGPDTGRLETSFQSAEPAVKSDVDKAVTAIRAGNYSQAMADLQRVASRAKLTPDQQQAINDVLAQLQKEISAAAKKAAGDAEKAAEDLKRSLPGTK
jgi:septation ring formation regulator EzrA